MQNNRQSEFADSPDVLLGASGVQTQIPVSNFMVAGDDFVILAGPCSMETESLFVSMALHAQQWRTRVLRGGAFQPRTSPYAFQGPDMDRLKLPDRVCSEKGLAIDTERMPWIALRSQQAQCLDMLQRAGGSVVVAE